MRTFSATLLGWIACPIVLAAGEPTFDPTESYRCVEVEGWRVLVNETLYADEHEELRGEVLRILGDQLYRIRRVVPEGPLAEMLVVPVWVEFEHPKHPCMCYHPSASWLTENGMNPEKVKGIELSNCRNFVKWTVDQPWMLLHELAHAYHDRVLGWDHPEIRACFEAARDSGLYDEVLHANGLRRRSYAMSDHKEYFAECSEAFFGRNDAFPFVRAELRRHDPRMFATLERIWGKDGRVGR